MRSPGTAAATTELGRGEFSPAFAPVIFGWQPSSFKYGREVLKILSIIFDDLGTHVN